MHEAIPISGKVLYREIPVHHRKEEEKDSKRNLKIYQSMEKAESPLTAGLSIITAKNCWYTGSMKKVSVF